MAGRSCGYKGVQIAGDAEPMRVPPAGQTRDEVARESYLAVTVCVRLRFVGVFLEGLKLLL